MTENKTPSCWNWLVFTKSQCQRCREKKELNKPCHLKPLYNMSGCLGLILSLVRIKGIPKSVDTWQVLFCVPKMLFHNRSGFWGSPFGQCVDILPSIKDLPENVKKSVLIIMILLLHKSKKTWKKFVGAIQEVSKRSGDIEHNLMKMFQKSHYICFQQDLASIFLEIQFSTKPLLCVRSLVIHETIYFPDFFSLQFDMEQMKRRDEIAHSKTGP